MFGSTNPFSSSSSSLFGATSTFGATSSSSPFGSTQTTDPFGSTFAGQTRSSIFGEGTSTGIFGATSSLFGASTHAFGSSSTPASGSTPSGSLSFRQKPAASTFKYFGTTQGETNPFGSPTFNQTQPAFGSQSFGSTPAFGASNTPTFGSSTPSFGATTSIFGASSTPAFGESSAPAFGQSSAAFGSTIIFGQSAPSFGASTTPAFGTTSIFGSSSASTFGSQASAAFGGAGTSTFGTSTFGTTAKPISISAMPAYKSKSVEELRWEDYQNLDKGPNVSNLQEENVLHLRVSGDPIRQMHTSINSNMLTARLDCCFEDLINYLLLARKESVSAEIDEELIYAYAKLDKIDEIEELIAKPDIAADLKQISDKLFDEQLHRASRVVLSYAFRALQNSRWQQQEDCCICFANPKDAALVPCGHRMCKACCSTIINSVNKKCPICTRAIGSLILLYG